MCVPVDLKSPQAGATGRCEVALSLGTPGAPEGIEPELASRVGLGIQKKQPEPPLPNQRSRDHQCALQRPHMDYKQSGGAGRIDLIYLL